MPGTTRSRRHIFAEVNPNLLEDWREPPERLPNIHWIPCILEGDAVDFHLPFDQIPVKFARQRPRGLLAQIATILFVLHFGASEALSDGERLRGTRSEFRVFGRDS
jgi:hypothetical protein